MNYSEVRIPVGRIPVAVQVSPVRVGIEPSDLLASFINSKPLRFFTEVSRVKPLYFMT